jgi:hypothetical protein
MLWKWREALFPGQRRVNREALKSEVFMNEIYDAIDKAFVEAIKAEERGHTGGRSQDD